jgi:hypothetical protein
MLHALCAMQLIQIDRVLKGCYFLINSFREAGWDRSEERGRRIERVRSVLFIERKGMKYVEKTIPSLDPVPHSHR